MAEQETRKARLVRDIVDILTGKIVLAHKGDIVELRLSVGAMFAAALHGVDANADRAKLRLDDKHSVQLKQHKDFEWLD